MDHQRRISLSNGLILDMPVSTANGESLFMIEQESVVLADESGQALLNTDGTPRTMNKLQAHKQGVLHLAVSVFIFNSHRELLLQKRAADKYHSPGKWTNTCCTHPFPGERPQVTAKRRLREEMGLS